MADLVSHGPKLDWTQDSGLYTWFQDWKEECKLILEGPLKMIGTVYPNKTPLIKEENPRGESKLPQIMVRFCREKACQKLNTQ